MKCNSCGTEIESGAVQCPQCGADLGGDSTSRAAARLKKYLSEASDGFAANGGNEFSAKDSFPRPAL